jgi:hypothetical protein
LDVTPRDDDLPAEPRSGERVSSTVDVGGVRKRQRQRGGIVAMSSGRMTPIRLPVADLTRLCPIPL